MPVLYTIAKQRMAQRAAGLLSAPSGFGMLLLRQSAAGAQSASLQTVADLLAVSGVQEVSGGYYSRQSLTGLNVYLDTGKAVIDSGDVTFGAVQGTSAVAAVIYEEGANDASRYLVMYDDWSSSPVSMDTGVNVQVQGFVEIQ